MSDCLVFYIFVNRAFVFGNSFLLTFFLSFFLSLFARLLSPLVFFIFFGRRYFMLTWQYSNEAICWLWPINVILSMAAEIFQAHVICIAFHHTNTHTHNHTGAVIVNQLQFKLIPSWYRLFHRVNDYAILLLHAFQR